MTCCRNVADITNVELDDVLFPVGLGWGAWRRAGAGATVTGISTFLKQIPPIQSSQHRTAYPQRPFAPRFTSPNVGGSLDDALASSNVASEED